jgi:hypothetical protein
MGTKEDESSTGHVWATGFYIVTARSCLARVLKLTKTYFHNFPFGGGGAAGNRGLLKRRYGGTNVYTQIVSGYIS